MNTGEKIPDEYNEHKKYVLDELKKISLPEGHPFLEYPMTPESRNLEFFILLSMLLGEKAVYL